MRPKKSKFLITIKILIILTPIIILGWVFNKQFAPLGQLTLEQNFKDNSFFISDFYPSERTERVQKDDGYYAKTIEGDTVYFDLTLPRLYKEAVVKVTYKNDAQPLINLGIQNAKSQWAFIDQSLESKALDTLSWEKTSEAGLTLWQKEPRYENISDLVANLPADKKILTHHYDGFDKLARQIKLDNYQPAVQVTKIDQALRGSHTILTYLKDENLDYSFKITDINQSFGDDSFKVSVYNYQTQEIVKSYSLKDDGVSEASEQSLQLDDFQIDIPDLSAGTYQISIEASDDIIIEEITTGQHLLVFSKKLNLADTALSNSAAGLNNNNVQLYTQANSLNLSTDNLAGLQDLLINDNSLSIREVNKKYIADQKGSLTASLNKIWVSPNNILLETDGYFVFNKENYFSPQLDNLSKITADTNLDESDYIIAEYSSPQVIDKNWRQAETKFDLTKAYLDKDLKVKFRLSAPGLFANQREIKVDKIEIKLYKDPLNWEKIKSKLKR